MVKGGRVCVPSTIWHSPSGGSCAYFKLDLIGHDIEFNVGVIWRLSGYNHAWMLPESTNPAIRKVQFNCDFLRTTILGLLTLEPSLGGNGTARQLRSKRRFHRNRRNRFSFSFYHFISNSSNIDQSWDHVCSHRPQPIFMTIAATWIQQKLSSVLSVIACGGNGRPKRQTNKGEIKSLVNSNYIFDERISTTIL